MFLVHTTYDNMSHLKGNYNIGVLFLAYAITSTAT